MAKITVPFWFQRNESKKWRKKALRRSILNAQLRRTPPTPSVSQGEQETTSR